MICKKLEFVKIMEVWATRPLGNDKECANSWGLSWVNSQFQNNNPDLLVLPTIIRQGELMCKTYFCWSKQFFMNDVDDVGVNAFQNEVVCVSGELLELGVYG